MNDIDAQGGYGCKNRAADLSMQGFFFSAQRPRFESDEDTIGGILW